MPLGKSGQHYMNPNVMRSKGDMPDQEQNDGASEMPAEQEGQAGDGMHHATITKHEDGSYSTEHTHPDGRNDGPMEHGSYQDAMSHEGQNFEEEGSSAVVTEAPKKPPMTGAASSAYAD